MNDAMSFTPAPRRRRRIASQRRVLWTGINLATALAGAIGALGACFTLLSDGSATAEALQAARARLDEVIAEQQAIGSELEKVEARLGAYERATVHPDWSILLAYISRVGAGTITLDGFVLEPVDGESERHKAYTVGLNGRTSSQNSVTEFVLALEQSKVFSSTELIRSGRGTSGSFTFAIRCTLGRPATDRDEGEAE